MATLDDRRSNTFDKLILWLYVLFVVLTPFYLWRSGLPQIADFVMVLLLASYLLRKRLVFVRPASTRHIVTVATLFVVHIIVVNVTWMLLLGKVGGFGRTSLFYIYNYFVFLLTISLYADFGPRLIQTVFGATVVSLLVQAAFFVVGGGFAGRRMVLWFNNPNQFGYYGLLTAAILMYCSKRTDVKRHWLAVGLLSATVLCLGSLSKAAIVACGAMMTIYIVARLPRWILGRMVVVLLGVIIVFGLFHEQLVEFYNTNRLLVAVRARVALIGRDSDDSLEGRGYDRIWKYPQYWVFGAGEGEWHRFDGRGMEFHSTLGNLQVSYGFVGLSLFVTLLLLASRNDRHQNAFSIVAILAYGLAHNGIRNTLLWVLLALISCPINERRLVGVPRRPRAVNLLLVGTVKDMSEEID
jgi:hypothetical protein